MKLIITTLGRIRNQVTLRNLPESIADRVELWVQDWEKELADKYYDGVFALPPEVRNLGQTRQYLLDLYRGEKIVLMDDDLTFYWRKDPEDWHLTTPPPEALEEMFAELEFQLNEYAHIGVSGREGQNRLPAQPVTCDRYMRFLAYNTARFPDHVRADRLSGMSDFDVNLQLLRAGLPSLILTRFAQGQPATQTPGGCSIDRTNDSHFAEVRKLCEMHAGIVVPRKKVNKSGGAFGQRDEVTVSWKMALGWDARVREPTLLDKAQAEAARQRELIDSYEKRIAALESWRDETAVRLQTTFEEFQMAIDKAQARVIPDAIDRRKVKLDISPPPKARVRKQKESNGAGNQV